MPSNKAEIEALIANSPVFQNAAGKTDALLGTNIVDRANNHIQDLTETTDADGRANALEAFVPDNASTAPKENLFEQPNLKNAFVDPTPSQRSKMVRDQTLGAFENLDALVDHSKDWAKPMGFNTGANDVDYDRYYYHPNFKKLGYSPFRDNESLYNANSSWWDDFTRMRSQWMGLAGEGFKSMIDQWKNPLDFSPNTEMAKSFEKQMAIAASTKDGFGAKFTNFVGNSGYTVGILADMVAEEAVLLGATALTQGRGAALTGPGMVGAFARGIAKIAKGTDYVNDVIKAYKETEGIRNTVNAINNADKARDIFNTAKKYGVNAVNFLNPLKNTVEFMKTVAGEAKAAVEIGKGTKKITNLALVSRGVGSFYKDVRMMNAAFAEARLEGGMVKNEKLRDWVGEFYNANGRLPEGEEADRINTMATDAGNKTALINIPMIYYTNELVLGKAFKGWVPTSVAREMSASTKGVRFLRTKVGKKVTYEGVEGIKKFGKSAYWKQAPTIIAADMLRYTSANFAEGTQESFQDIVSTGVKDYYQSIYTNPALAGHRQAYGSFTKGLGAQFSKHGAETFLSGFFMGALIQGPQNLIYTHGRTAAQAAGEKAGFVPKGTAEKLKQEKEAWINHVQKSLNAVAENPEEFAKALDLNMTRQTSLFDVMNKALSDKDQKSFEDGKSESMFQHFYTLMQSGHFDNLVQELESLKGLKAEELAEAFNEKDADGMHEKLNKIIARAHQIKEHYEEINTRFTDDIDPYQFDPIKEPVEFKNAQRRKVAFREAKMHAAFGDYAFNDALSRMESITRDAADLHKPLAKAPSSAISILFDPFRGDGALSMEIKSLRNQVKTFKGSTPENEALIPKTREKIDALVDLQRKIKKYDSLFELQRKGSAVPEAVITESETALNDLHASYKSYLKLLADEVGESLLDKNIPASFSGLVDFIELNRESKNMARFINYLHDPDNFLKYVDSFDDELAKQLEKWYDTNKEALTKYIGRQDMNIFINILFDKGVFLTPESIEDLANKKFSNLEFVNATTGGPIEKTSDKYINEIKPIIDLFSEVETEQAAPAPEGTPEPAPVVEPTREQVQASTELLGGIVFHLKAGRTTSYNPATKKWEFKNRNGKLVTNRKQIEKLSIELASKPGIVRVWWKEQISNEDRDFIRGDFDRLFDIYQSGAMHQQEFIRTPEFVIMEALQGTKFKTSADVDKNTTDINKRSWIEEDGISVDNFATNVMDDLAEAGAANMDEQDIINSVYDLINRYPEGIKKKDLEDYQAQNNDTKDLIALASAFAHTHGLDIQIVYNKLDDLKLLDYESKTERQAEPTPADTAEPAPQENVGIPTEEPPIEEDEVYTGEPEIEETEVVSEVEDSEEIKALRDAAAAKVEDPAAKLEILMGKRDAELTTEAPKVEAASIQEQYKEAVSNLEWARDNNDESGVLMYRAIADDLRAQLPKREVKPLEKASIIDQIVKTDSLKDLITLRTRIFKDASLDLNYFKNITASEIEKLYNAKLESLVKSVTFANISKGDYLIMSNRKSFPTGVGVVTYKTPNSIKVRAITESGTPDQFSSVEISKNNIANSVQNIYSEALAKDVVATAVDPVTTELAKENIKNEPTMSDPAELQKAMKNADNKNLKTLLDELDEEDKNC